MGILRSIPDVEAWLDADANEWTSLDDREYKAVVRRWSDVFLPRLEAGSQLLWGEKAILDVESRLPAAVVILSGTRIRSLANLGGCGAAVYRAAGLRQIDRDLANARELILTSEDLTWCCVFTHEAGAFSSECLIKNVNLN
ncbi:hypothetical protein [Aquisphaera insulae]|uniref:hypothetical protein n=1 Tax=Aquisphaera insulae TaxID=2712864 RepID=UPI0013EB04BD|nr:hypothetical protein [Aquisphaera insulae]